MTLEELRNSRKSLEHEINEGSKNGDHAESAFGAGLLYIGDVIFHCFASSEEEITREQKQDDLEEVAEILDNLQRTAPGMDLTDIREQAHKAYELVRSIQGL
jgi:hypothetical protein